MPRIVSAATRKKIADRTRERWATGDLGSPAVRRKRSLGIKRAYAKKAATAVVVRRPRAVISNPPLNAQSKEVLSQASVFELTAAATAGHISAIIEDYARRACVPSAILAARVTELLLASTGGEVR